MHLSLIEEFPLQFEYIRLLLLLLLYELCLSLVSHLFDSCSIFSKLCILKHFFLNNKVDFQVEDGMSFCLLPSMMGITFLNVIRRNEIFLSLADGRYDIPS